MNKLDIKKIQRDFAEEQRKLKACKTKDDLNNLFKGRTIVIKGGHEWDGERCEFVEMVGEGKRETWLMKVRTSYGTFLEISGKYAMIVAETIPVTVAEAEEIRKQLFKES